MAPRQMGAKRPAAAAAAFGGQDYGRALGLVCESPKLVLNGRQPKSLGSPPSLFVQGQRG